MKCISKVNGIPSIHHQDQAMLISRDIISAKSEGHLPP